jgi:DNA repair exonuclease SbcCD ATPase subunit
MTQPYAEPVTTLLNIVHLLVKMQAHLIDLLERQVVALEKMEKHMADLDQSIEELQEAVDNINIRFASEIAYLQEALDAANAALANEDLDDAERDQALADALAQIESASGAIKEQVDELNGIGRDPEVPVEPDPDLPHVDNTLPNPDDQPHVEHH